MKKTNDADRQKNSFPVPESNVHRTYKDRLFRMVFREKKELLSLYNAVYEK